MTKVTRYIPRRGIVVMLTGTVAAIWGFVFVATDIVLDYIDAAQLQAVRWTLATLVLVLMAALRVFPFQFKKEHLPWLLGIGICQGIVAPLGDALGVHYASASQASIIEALIPCVSIALGALFFGKKTDGKGILFIIITFCGVLISTVMASGFSQNGQLLGYVCLIIATVAIALYSQLSAKIGEEVNALTITTVMAFMGMVVHNAINFFRGYGISTYVEVFTQLKPTLGVLFLGVVSCVICFTLFNKAMAYADNPGVASNINQGLTTGIGVVAAVLIRGDAVGWYTIVGLVLVLIGVALSARKV